MSADARLLSHHFVAHRLAQVFAEEWRRKEPGHPANTVRLVAYWWFGECLAAHRKARETMQRQGYITTL